MSRFPAPSTPAAEGSEPARSFQHYEVLRHPDGSPWELGRGTMGITYKAFDVNLCCEVALKVVNAALLDSVSARERFVREAKAAASLRHRNVASVYHLGNDGERFFYAMEFIDGETLDALVRRQGPLAVDLTLRLLLQTVRALAAAGRQNLVHRDIKPANIMVTHEDADDHMVVKVIDFGLARPVSDESGGSSGQLTGGGFVGTPQFASPEQLEEKPLDTRSDIYSLGVTTWFLLTGRAPFTGSLATICHQHLHETPPWDALPEWLPGPVRKLLAHMLEKDPARRPQDAVELRREIETCVATVKAHPAAEAPRPRRADPAAPVQAGTILQGRYTLTRLVGEGHRGHIYRGRDDHADGRAVTIIFLSGEMFDTPAECERLDDEVRLIRAAAHPHLTQVFAFERAARGGTAGFLVEEWINGGTLVDLLAARSGALTPAEGLRLLGQAAAAADHAADRRLEHLDLAIHQMRLHFPAPGAASPREHLATRMDDWPAWALKINPLGLIRENPEMNTWAGEVTLVPEVQPVTGGGAPATLAARYLRALAALTYELLGGAPGVLRLTAGAGGKYVSLPALNEAGNAALQQALDADPGFRRGRDFYETLARAAGFDPVNLQTHTDHSTRTAGRDPARSQTRAARPARTTGNPPPTQRPRTGSTGVFSGWEDRGFAARVDDEDTTVGSIADRLTLIEGDAPPVGRWLFGIAAAGAVFVAVVAGVWIMLAQRLPARAATPTPAPVAVPPPASRQRPTATPRPTVPPPLPKEPVRLPSPPPALAPAQRDIPAATPAPTAPPQKLVNLRVRSIPSGAEITCEGRTLGTTPLEVELPPGVHELAARFDGWPETRETVALAEGQSRAATEIHLMPPNLVPGVNTPPPTTHPNHSRREMPVAPAIPVEPTPRPEPEIRRALPPLTPFDPDAAREPSGSPGGD